MKAAHGISLLFVAALLGLDPSPARAVDQPKQKNPPAKGPRPDADAPRVQPKRPADKIVAFKKTPQRELKAHIYFPPGWTARDRRPAIIFWSGGGFKRSGVSQFLAQAEYFASRGLVAICADYRVKETDGTLIEKCAEDARSAIRWVKGHAAELGIAPEKVIASGGSAGGGLSLLVARAKGPDGKDDDLSLSTRPAALVLFNPAMGEYVLEVVGRGGEAQAAVNAQIAALDTPQKDEPPSIMFFGTEDVRFLATSREFCRKAKAQGTRCEVWVADRMRHGFFNQPPWHGATMRKADEFLTSLGYLEGPPKVVTDPSAVLNLSE